MCTMCIYATHASSEVGKKLLVCFGNEGTKDMKRFKKILAKHAEARRATVAVKFQQGTSPAEQQSVNDSSATEMFKT